MYRVELIQSYIDKYSYSRYLEIGTFKGESFFPIRCRKKIAVDPSFLFSKKDRLFALTRNKCNLKNSYYELESNDFFKNHKNEFLKNKVDIAFIDGLHTFRASLEDSLNTLSILKKEGTVILHDCYPPHEAAAAPAKSYDDAYNNRDNNWTGEWCGDVWKTVVYLSAKYPSSLEIFTIEMDYGLGVIKPIDLNLDLKIDEELFQKINKLDYQDFKKDYRNLLNLQTQKIL